MNCLDRKYFYFYQTFIEAFSPGSPICNKSALVQLIWGTQPLPEPMWHDLIWVTIGNSKFKEWSEASTVGTPYNTNVGVQKIPDRAIWKPMVAKRNNTNPWSWLRPQILVTQDSGQPHMSKQPASRDWPEQIAPLVHSSQTAWQLFNLGQSIEIRIPHLLGHVGQLHTKCISHIWLRFSVL